MLSDQASFTNVSICLFCLVLSLFINVTIMRASNAPRSGDTFRQIRQIRQTADKPFILQTLALNYFRSRHVGHCHARIHANGPMVAHSIYGARKRQKLWTWTPLSLHEADPRLAVGSVSG